MTNAPSPLPAAPSAAQAARPRSEEPEPRSRAGTYAGVLVTEALVVAALWAFSRYFTP